MPFTLESGLGRRGYRRDADAYATIFVKPTAIEANRSNASTPTEPTERCVCPLQTVCPKRETIRNGAKTVKPRRGAHVA